VADLFWRYHSLADQPGRDLWLRPNAVRCPPTLPAQASRHPPSLNLHRKKIGGSLLAELRMQGNQGLLPERAASFKAETRFSGMLSETLSSNDEARRSAKSIPCTSHSATK
jgi:hypothetical protein